MPPTHAAEKPHGVGFLRHRNGCCCAVGEDGVEAGVGIGFKQLAKPAGSALAKSHKCDEPSARPSNSARTFGCADNSRRSVTPSGRPSRSASRASRRFWAASGAASCGAVAIRDASTRSRPTYLPSLQMPLPRELVTAGPELQTLQGIGHPFLGCWLEDSEERQDTPRAQRQHRPQAGGVSPRRSSPPCRRPITLARPEPQPRPRQRPALLQPHEALDRA